MAAIAQELKGWLGLTILTATIVLVGGETLLQDGLAHGRLPQHPVTPNSSVSMQTGMFLQGQTGQEQISPQQIAQGGNYPVCQPPAPNEYLLLVVTRTPESQTQTQKLLPPNTSVITCAYLNDVVTRVGGFRTMDRANAWARYITETTQLAAYVVRPAETPGANPSPPTAPPTNSPTGSGTTTPGTPSPGTSSPPPPTKPTPTVNPTGSASVYNPKPLGAGYAVLVDYFNQPELARKIQQALGQDIGLVAYGQRPYLLATYTTDQTAANAVLQTLSDRGFWATVVDSRRVILLRQRIALDAAGN